MFCLYEAHEANATARTAAGTQRINCLVMDIKIRSVNEGCGSVRVYQCDGMPVTTSKCRDYEAFLTDRMVSTYFSITLDSLNSASIFLRPLSPILRSACSSIAVMASIFSARSPELCTLQRSPL